MDSFPIPRMHVVTMTPIQIPLYLLLWMELGLKLTISILYLTQQHQVYGYMYYDCATIIRLFTQDSIASPQNHSLFTRRFNRLKQQYLREKNRMDKIKVLVIVRTTSLLHLLKNKRVTS